MVPQRSVVTRAVLTLSAAFCTAMAVAAAPQDPPTKPQPAPPPTAASKASAADAPATPAIPIEDRPYKIRAFVSLEPASRIDARGRDDLLNAWKSLARRIIGPAWEIEIAESEGSTAAFDLAELTPAMVKPLGTGVDKVWIIQGKVVSGDLTLYGCELDVATGWLGSLHSRKVVYEQDVVRSLFWLSDQIFAPYAEIGDSKGDSVMLRVQGSALPKGLNGDAIAPTGSIFRPVRVYLKPDNTVLRVDKILYSYLRITIREGRETWSTLIRGVKDPLTKRVARKNRLVALGIKPATMTTKLRFVQSSNKEPGAGYVLTYRTLPAGLPREIATTDREGRVTIPAGFADGLVVLKLIAGNSEPMVELPLMPGETVEELTVPFDPKLMTITIETEVEALKDAITDLVNVRKRLERRMKTREQGEDWNGVADVIRDFKRLPPREGFVKRLDNIEAAAKAQEKKTKGVVITRTAKNQLAETRAMIDQYLDDEVFKAYEDAADRSKARDARMERETTKSKKSAGKK